jgi:hypothetical protein
MRLANLVSDSRIESNDTGIITKTGVFAPLTIGYPAGAVDQAFTTPVANVPPNQPLRFDLQLQALSSMAGEGFTESNFFGGTNGFFLPFGIPVFNLPPGYMISIPEMNIINNFVALPATLSGDVFIVGSNASEISLPGVTQVAGSMNVSGNGAATVINLSDLESVGGSINVSSNGAATVINLSDLASAGGSINVSDNGAATVINLGDLGHAGGSITISNNSSATGVYLGALTTVGGDVDISGNSAVTNIDLGSVTIVGGSVDISANSSVTNIDLGAVTIVGGEVDVSGNGSATVIDLSELATVNGDVLVANNGTCTTVTMGALTTVTGDLVVETCGTSGGAFTPGPAAAGGDTTLTTTGYTAVAGTTATGSTTVSTGTSDAFMTVRLPAGSFTRPVPFTITELDPATLAPEAGLGMVGEPATIDPIAAYQITFGVPTLNANATLTFDIVVANLDSATATALFNALAAGTATLATRSDVAGSQYQAFPVCADGQIPTSGGCVRVQLLDANGQPTTGTPAIVRFSNVVGHFSIWAVALVTPTSTPASVFNGLLQPYPAPPHNTTPTFKRGRVVPLKFGWLNSSGAPLGSAGAAPQVAIYSASCATQAPTTQPITPEDAGASGGLRYDASTSTWIFNWSTKGLSVGCFAIAVTPGNAAFATPPSTFPIALSDR